MLLARADWLVRKWIASTIHWAADESSLLDHFSVYLKKLTYFMVFLCYVLK